MKKFKFDFRKVAILVQARGISHRQIAKKSGLSDHGVGRMIRGDHRPRVDNLAKIAYILGVEPGFFFSEEDEK